MPPPDPAAALAPARLSRKTACWLHPSLELAANRRGETLDICQTIFFRPTLDFSHSIARIARHRWRGEGARPQGPVGDVHVGAVENRP